MNANALMQSGLFLLVLLAVAFPLGAYMARVYTGRPCGLDRVLGPVERLVYKLVGIDPEREMNWKSYAIASVLFGGVSILFLYALQRVQGYLPFNPSGFGAVAPNLALNTAASFVTNTNWQAYGGETTMSYFTQMFGLTVQNFVSAAAGMAVCAALIRALSRRECATIGNFWKDIVRSTVYVLMPLCVIITLILVSQGTSQTLEGPAIVQLMEPVSYEVPASGSDQIATQETVTTQEIARGPVASQVAIKHLGTNGGGFFSVNSAHPLENPTPLSNFFEMLAILIIPAGLCLCFGIMVLSSRQGVAILAAMTIIFVLALSLCLYAEQTGNPRLTALGVDQQAVETTNFSVQPPVGGQSGGSMEGKEVRFGAVNSALFATVTTSASCGAVNSMHDSFTPLGGLVPMLLMQLGEVVYGGVGSGLYGMLCFAILAVFVAGLMVGRTPEYLGKKIEPFEMKMASIVILVPPFLSLLGTAAGAMWGPDSIANPGAHGLSEILYGFSSMSNNNGSAFAGLKADTPVYNLVGALCMFGSRFWIMVPVLAIAGSMAAKKTVPQGAGTLPTDSLLFVIMLVSIVFVVGALTFFPALALSPIVEQLTMYLK